VSAEFRWFWNGEVPADVRSWFETGGAPPGGGEICYDRYFHQRGDCELGVKIRDEGRSLGSLEIKGLVRQSSLLRSRICGLSQGPRNGSGTEIATTPTTGPWPQ
jgi:hypothetical protein